MNTRIANAPAWPITVDRHGADCATVLLEDGRRVELDVFRDDCRTRAQALRREAMVEASAAMSAALRRTAVAAARLLRPAFARKAGVRTSGA